jgi:VIT1/CCC1 family predicted Fe2+/Mn2+ transporter
MFQYLKKGGRLFQTKFSFGATSAIITNLGLIVGLDKMANPQAMIIGGILAVALADNISDSFGIHIYQESECINHREVWFSTLTNFFARLLVSLTFVFLVVFLPMSLAIPFSIVWGLFLLAILSYSIAKSRGLNPLAAIGEHVGIALFVLFASNFVGGWISSRF